MLTLPRPPGPPVLNATAALAGGAKDSRAVAVLTSTAVTASTTKTIIVSAATDQRSLLSVTVICPESGDEPLDEPLATPLDEPLAAPLDEPLAAPLDEPLAAPSP